MPRARKAARVTFAKWVLRRKRGTLGRWVYSDGTAFYLARDSREVEDRKYAALGPMVWRMANGSDGLYEDCVGPSAYWKALRRCSMHGQACCMRTSVVALCTP